MTAMDDTRLQVLRWAAMDSFQKAHLWLGQIAACNRPMKRSLRAWIPMPDEMCPECAAYARGWLDRHDTGRSPALVRGTPNPLQGAAPARASTALEG